MSDFINFFNHPFFWVTGGITTIFLVLGLLYKIICGALGISPVVFRLGIALWKRDIAIFSVSDRFDDLESILIRSKLFKKKNINKISKDNIIQAKENTIFLVDYEEFKEKIGEILNTRLDDQTPIIIYAKPKDIDDVIMKDIESRHNILVVNFKGRLLNDILTLMITTSYGKK